MKKLILFTFIGFCLLACKKNETSTTNQLRIRNDTQAILDSVYVKLGTANNSYGRLVPGNTSDYKKFSDTGYPYLRISSGGKTTELQIALTDNNPPGMAVKQSSTKQTCVITINNTNSFDLHFETD